VAGSGQIRQLRRRIKSVKSTQKITRAMEMIAASRIIRAQRRVNEARPYAEQIHEVIKGLAVANEVKAHPLLSAHDEVRRVGVLVITSDRGLAGAYNANILKQAERVIRDEEAEGHEVVLYVVGRKAVGYFAYRGRRPERVWTGISDAPQMEDASTVGETVMRAYQAEELDRVWLLYTDFKSSLTQVPHRMKLLPVDATEFEGGDGIPPEFMFEPDPSEILELLIPRYVEAKIFHGLLESSASEHASRQRAMKSATDNAQEVVENLSRVMNQARQDQITTEISEIVGGAEALSSGR
jgi:F-type H+-transporting ATPase subunit gamma